ncbi:ATPase [Microlunatus endophyticus]|uniref:ATPase n=1 Tax=Microlunatus endophyticus TaxID=1716077 RepID=A0A917S7G8_9ACTN|nr:AAA family ATPase [Microlunatus endophyticus]GGL62855.1 ATPase [Microlunatus endophyticus]
MLTTLAIEGYRSIRSLRVGLGPVTVVTGPNGSGKSNLYRGLRVLAATGRDGAIAALAREGGLDSTLWAGPEVIGRAVREGLAAAQGTVRSGPVALRLGFASDGFGYALDLGLPIPSRSMFCRDPEIKVEAVWHGPVLRPSGLLAERKGSQVRLREASGWQSADRRLRPWESMLDEIDSPDLRGVRTMLRGWRFYDHIRTDAESPVRAPAVGTRTPVLSADGNDLAAALQTIRELGDADQLAAAIDRAFPGSRLEIGDVAGRMQMRLRQSNLLRSLGAEELSDGTLRYLVWVAALLSARPAELIVLNEPETSLHPDLLGPLVGQLERGGATLVELDKPHGETVVVDQGLLTEPAWSWPKR